MNKTLMDRAEAIKRLEDLVITWDGDSFVQESVDAFKLAIAALREQEQREWISVEEKPMPSNNEEYEVCSDYHGKKRIEIHKGWNTHCVTHWRPLPEPPKGGADHE